MKPLFLNLVVFIISLGHPMFAQEEYPLLKLLERLHPDENPASKNTKKENSHHRKHHFFNDCYLVTRADYLQPTDYSSNFVQLPGGQRYRGTSTGISMWDNYTYIRITTENSDIPDNNITALALDDDDNLWIGTKNAGIVIGSGRFIKPFKTTPVQTRDQHIVSISTDSRGLMWVVYENGGIECFLNGISCTYFQ
jgi:hypothetical protein